MRARSLAVVGVSLLAASPLAAQGRTGALPPELRTRVQDARLDPVSSIRGLPLGVRSEMQHLFGGTTLDIAEPNGASPATGDIPVPKLPRRLVAAGCSQHDCLIYYERGPDSARSWRVALFHWTPDATTCEWGGTAPGGLKTIDAVRRAVLAGAIKPTTGPW